MFNKRIYEQPLAGAKKVLAHKRTYFDAVHIYKVVMLHLTSCQILTLKGKVDDQKIN